MGFEAVVADLDLVVIEAGEEGIGEAAGIIRDPFLKLLMRNRYPNQYGPVKRSMTAFMDDGRDGEMTAGEMDFGDAMISAGAMALPATGVGVGGGCVASAGEQPAHDCPVAVQGASAITQNRKSSLSSVC